MSRARAGRGETSDLDLDSYSRPCADCNSERVGNYLRANRYLDGRRLQAALGHQRRRRQSPAKAGRGELSRRQWQRIRCQERA